MTNYLKNVTIFKVLDGVLILLFKGTIKVDCMEQKLFIKSGEGTYHIVFFV